MSHWGEARRGPLGAQDRRVESPGWRVPWEDVGRPGHSPFFSTDDPHQGLEMRRENGTESYMEHRLGSHRPRSVAGGDETVLRKPGQHLNCPPPVSAEMGKSLVRATHGGQKATEDFRSGSQPGVKSADQRPGHDCNNCANSITSPYLLLL